MSTHYIHRLIISSDANGYQIKDVARSNDLTLLKETFSENDVVQMLNGVLYNKPISTYLEEHASEIPVDTDETTVASEMVDEPVSTVDTINVLTNDDSVSETPIEPTNDTSSERDVEDDQTGLFTTSSTIAKTLLVKLDPHKRKPDLVDLSNVDSLVDDHKVYAVGKSTFFRPMPWGIVRSFLGDDDVFTHYFLPIRGNASITQSRHAKLEQLVGHSIPKDDIIRKTVDTIDDIYTLFMVPNDNDSRAENDSYHDNTPVMESEESIESASVDETSLVERDIHQNSVSQTNHESDSAIAPSTVVSETLVINSTSVATSEVTTVESECTSSITESTFNHTTSSLTVNESTELFSEPSCNEDMAYYNLSACSPLDQPIINDGTVPEDNMETTSVKLTGGTPFETYVDPSVFTLRQTIDKLTQVTTELEDQTSRLQEQDTALANANQRIQQLEPTLTSHVEVALTTLLSMTPDTASDRTKLILSVTDAIKVLANPDIIPPSHIEQNVLALASAIFNAPDPSDAYLNVVRAISLL